MTTKRPIPSNSVWQLSQPAPDYSDVGLSNVERRIIEDAHRQALWIVGLGCIGIGVLLDKLIWLLIWGLL